MMDERTALMAEIERLKTAVKKTDSRHLKRDYDKAIRKKLRKLRFLDRKSS